MAVEVVVVCSKAVVLVSLETLQRDYQISVFLEAFLT